jgi:hypothetical protein
LIKYPKPNGDDMADKATRKKRTPCDLLQIRNFITNKAKAILRGKEMGAKEWEAAVVEAGFAAYKHPRYQRKPHNASIKAALRREFRKFAGTTTPKRKGKKVVRGKAGEGKTLTDAPRHYRTEYFPNPRQKTPPYEPYNDPHDPYAYRPKAGQANPIKKIQHPLGSINELSRKTDSELVAATEEMKDLIRKQNALVEDIRKLQDRKAKIDAFLNGKETLEILTLLQQ